MKLFLSALISPWQFFKESVPAPSIEYALSATAQDAHGNWQGFCFRPEKRSLIGFVLSIFFNPRWNEYLYLMDCAERIIANSSQHSIQEIFNAIKAELKHQGCDLKASPYLQFRVIFSSRHGAELKKELLFVSQVEDISKELAS